MCETEKQPAVDLRRTNNKASTQTWPCFIKQIYNTYLSKTPCITKHKCFVECSGFLSSNFIHTSEVPQGSVLGPRIFNILINDIANDISSSVLLYADDMKLNRRITSIEDGLVLQSNLDKVHTWCLKIFFQLNFKKCYLLLYCIKSYDKC